MKYLIIFCPLLLLLFSCDNQKQVKDSKNKLNQEPQLIEQAKEQKLKMIDSLNNEITLLNQNKDKLSKNIDYTFANIYSTLNNSFLDYIIIGTENLEKIKLLLNSQLGFSINDKKTSKNGISNFIIQFEDSSKIEFVSSDNKLELQFALRTNNIKELFSNLKTISSPLNIFSKSKIHSTISQSKTSASLPFSIIQYHNRNKNIVKGHLNKANKISAVWLTTPDIRKTIEQYSTYGFSLVDTLTVANIKQKTALIKNNNLDLILINGKDYSILGLTLKVSNLEDVQKLFVNNLNKNFAIKKNKRGRSIYLSPQITKTIWLEFLGN